MLVASLLLLLQLLLLAEVLAAIRIVFNEEDEGGGEDESKTAGAREEPSCKGRGGASVAGSGLTWPLRARVRVSENRAVVQLFHLVW